MIAGLLWSLPPLLLLAAAGLLSHSHTKARNILRESERRDQ